MSLVMMNFTAKVLLGLDLEADLARLTVPKPSYVGASTFSRERTLSHR
jgi:hypothetical protein